MFHQVLFDRGARIGGAAIGVLVVLLFSLTAATGTAAAQATAPDCSAVDYSGIGTEQNPYEVGSLDQLQCVADEKTETGLNDSYEQTADIDASDTKDWNPEDEFEEVIFPREEGEQIELARSPVTEILDTEGVDVELVDSEEGVAELRENVSDTFDLRYRTRDSFHLGFNPVGELSFAEFVEFNGTFDGAGHEITGLTVDRKTGERSGLFGAVTQDGVIRNVTVNDADITSGEAPAGGLVGSNIAGDGGVIDSKAEGEVTGETSAGGLVGFNSRQIIRSRADVDVVAGFDGGGLSGQNGLGGEIADSFAIGEVEADRRAGGLVGRAQRDSVIVKSYATGDVEGGEPESEITVPGSGGLIGRLGEGKVVLSSAKGDVTGNENVGGLVGGTSDGEITDSHSEGNVTGSKNVGGLVGEKEDAKISESYAEGSVTGNRNVGGLVGTNWARFSDSSIVTESRAVGDVEGEDNVGGLVGRNNEGNVTKSYARGDVSGNVSVGGLVGRSDSSSFYPDSDPTVERSYATGSVDGNESIGGIVGQMGIDPSEGDAVLRDSYWDTTTTGRSEAVGEEEPEDGTVVEGVLGLMTDEMRGTASEANMDTLDFVEVWRTITDSDDYPVLAWEVTDDTDPAFFEVSIDSTNSPIEGGETLTIETTVENTGGELNAQEVTSDAESLGSDATTFFLNPGELTTETFSIPTDEGDAGTYTVTVETRDDTDAATLTVTEKDVTKSPVEGVSDDLWTAVTQNDGDDGLSLADLGNAIQVYQNSPDNADVDGVSIGLSDLGALIQYYQSEVV